MFTKVKAFFERRGRTGTPVAGLGDDASLSPGSDLHVLNGNMPCAVHVTPVGSFPSKRAHQVKDLAGRVAG